MIDANRSTIKIKMRPHANALISVGIPDPQIEHAVNVFFFTFVTQCL